MMLAARIPGKTTIRNAACEPHIENLAEMLAGMGAAIEGAGTDVITIAGTHELGPSSCEVWPDRTEAGTFAALGAALQGEVCIHNVRPEHHEMVLLVLERMGVDFEFEGHCMKIQALCPAGRAANRYRPLAQLSDRSCVDLHRAGYSGGRHDPGTRLDVRKPGCSLSTGSKTWARKSCWRTPTAV